MSRRDVVCYSGPTVVGIDVSHHQGRVDWDAVAASGVRFAFIRTGDGTSIDRRFVENWREAGRVGLRRGAYHYFRPRHGGDVQAALVADLVEEAGGWAWGDLPAVVDLETTDDRSDEVVVAGAEVFLRVVEQRTRRRPMVYSGSFWNSLATRSPHLAEALSAYPLWTPSYTSQRPPRCARSSVQGFPKWTIWQYTSHGSVPGVSTRADVNLFRGDESDLAAFVRSRRKLPLAALVLLGLGAAGATAGGLLWWRDTR